MGLEASILNSAFRCKAGSEAAILNIAFPCKSGLEASILHRALQRHTGLVEARITDIALRSQAGSKATIAPHPDTGLVLGALTCLGSLASEATASATVSTLTCRVPVQLHCK